mmetsp:Transcript_2835/g.6609  ORF Transcript_2835/g.6609 Transcript_2835/m.6609 type:complete len:203 (-) Transcript_2835:206-814(-)
MCPVSLSHTSRPSTCTSPLLSRRMPTVQHEPRSSATSSSSVRLTLLWLSLLIMSPRNVVGSPTRMTLRRPPTARRRRRAASRIGLRRSSRAWSWLATCRAATVSYLTTWWTVPVASPVLPRSSSLLAPAAFLPLLPTASFWATLTSALRSLSSLRLSVSTLFRLQLPRSAELTAGCTPTRFTSSPWRLSWPRPSVASTRRSR